MIAIGYMYKKVEKKPDWLNTDQVLDIYSVSGCISEDFAHWMDSWKHNGYWFFDNPEIMHDLAGENRISLDGMTLFYYTAYEKQWDNDHRVWLPYSAHDFPTKIVQPENRLFKGFDLVSFSGQTAAECSPLSCNGLSEEINVNTHCLLDTLDEAKFCLEKGKLNHCEPGPYRIFAVHTLETR